MTQSRREERVRELMDGPHPHVPPEFGQLAIERGHRLLRRKRWVRNAALAVLLLATVALMIWAAQTEPWNTQPTPRSPPGFGW